MKRGLVSLAIATLVVASPTLMAKSKQDVKENDDKVSYSLGIELGEAFKTQGLDIAPARLAEGMQDAMAGKEYKLSRDDIDQTLIAFRKEQIAKQEVKIKEIANDNIKLGQDYMNRNKAEKGVSVTESGIQYKVLKTGKGKKPTATDVVQVNYEGKFIDGQVFDSSYKRGEPAQFRLNQVIAGWTEALQMMPEGSTWEIVIPPQLAYGEHGMGGMIGPNETLIFKVELLKVNPA